MSEVINRFDPLQFSKEECEWLLENLDKPAIVALRSIKALPMPNPGKRKHAVIFEGGVNPNSVKPILERLQELDELQKHGEIQWVGREAIKKAIQVYLEQDSKWDHAHRRNPRIPRFPSLYSWDAKGRAHLGGPDSDSGQVRTYFDEKGKRIPFAVDLVISDEEVWSPPVNTETPADYRLTEDTELRRFECRVPTREGICGHTESYRADSRSSRAAARARMSKHLRKATESAEIHREVHTLEFGGSDA